ncbi:YhdH/YhfP family quinone oxidoreductase [Trichlorobacter lovleyi]|uniref:YhdH/YhfP family quinone oxidoreductase n=1 Tax=Trichlorobacter lovleyi TaxID=313985 RepID=UPI00223FC808|nr:YhdH/YhfP family quinone oxidoreductase [Trichlorobacter lovleyi]QOX79981.1 YhdH/YhfP family quinone oxidoreductase [Trichlorobacter lovleyi]
MEPVSFKAFIVEETAPKQFSRRIGERTVADLPPGEVIIKVAYSSLNYKDALSATGNPGVTRNFPHTPGIDAAGTIADCSDNSFSPGQQVLVTGYDLGMNTSGGFGQYIRVPSAWVVPLPDGLTLRESMILGTAGFTAALSVLKLVNNGVTPEQGDILVTGASGGVGSIAVALLARAGYRVVAATGKPATESLLKKLGAAESIHRDELLKGAERPLMKERWAGAVDVAGGATLAAVLKATRYGGTVTCCGLVDSAELPANVFPFILRGVSLLGIDSVQCPMAPRLEVWHRLANDWKLDNLADAVHEISLDGLEAAIMAMLEGRAQGRTLVRL